VGTSCADHVTPLYPQKLALTSPTGGGRSVGIVRVRTKATELRPRFDVQLPRSQVMHKTGHVSGFRPNGIESTQIITKVTSQKHTLNT